MKALLWPAIAALAMLGVLALVLVLRPPAEALPASSASVLPDPSGQAQLAAPGEWLSATWQPIGNPFEPHEPALLRVDGLIGSEHGFDGWGRIPAPGRNELGDLGAVFHSPDGLVWTAVAIDHGVNAGSASTVNGVASGRLGLLAWGSVCCAPEQPAAWHSRDGSTWTRLPIELDPMPAAIHDVVAVRDLWVAAGTLADGTGRVWASSDGATWEAVLETEAGMPGVAVSDLARTGDGVVAVGTVNGPDGTYDGAAWFSADGRRWERVADPTEQLTGEGEVRIDRAVPFGERLLLTGLFGTTEEREDCERIGMVAAAGELAPITALSCGWGRDHLWLMDEDGSWQRVDPADSPGLRPIEFRHVVAGGHGLLLLGESSAPASPDISLFASADGLEWSLVEPALPIGTATATGFAIANERLAVMTDSWDGSTSELRAWVAESD